jgi:hypothetical protein
MPQSRVRSSSLPRFVSIPQITTRVLLFIVELKTKCARDISRSSMERTRRARRTINSTHATVSTPHRRSDRTYRCRRARSRRNARLIFSFALPLGTAPTLKGQPVPLARRPPASRVARPLPLLPLLNLSLSRRPLRRALQRLSSRTGPSSGQSRSRDSTGTAARGEPSCGCAGAAWLELGGSRPLIIRALHAKPNRQQQLQRHRRCCRVDSPARRLLWRGVEW